MVAPPKQIISHKSVHWYQWPRFCLKKNVFAKIAIFQIKMFDESKIFFRLTQATNIGHGLWKMLGGKY